MSEHDRAERERYMRLALSEAQTAYAENEVPVGAVLVRDGAVIAAAHNRCIALSDPTAHAEQLCLSAGAGLCGGRLTDCTLYVTMEPCAMCAGAAVNCKLGRIVFGAYDAAAGCCGSRIDLTDHCFLHTCEVWGGVLEQDCAALLSAFFQSKRGV